ncbi:uncharacterized protein in vnfD 5'region-like [Planococcus citri]|uniref:uncharacterized protein in vnfD 5'region-like n=1 Tax=Planococcus citri TaxID=170843 RepID=UPI0031F895DB
MPLFATFAMFFKFFSIILANLHQSESTVNLCTSQTPFEQTGHPLPLRNHTWQIIREHNFLYIDKTPFLMKLLHDDYEFDRCMILTRPPGFGKTTFLDMVADFFRGKKDMFKGLAIDAVGNTKYYDWHERKISGPLPKWKEFPVIHLNFREISNFNTKKEFYIQFEFLLKRIAETYRVNTDDRKYFSLGSLIRKLYDINYNPVAILVDEYDYPFHHAYTELNNTELATQIKSHLESMKSTIKTNTDKIGLAFFAGVLSLNVMFKERSGMKVFSDLTDLTLDKDLAEAFGFTENEIKNNMSPYLKKWTQNRNATENVKHISDDPRLHEKTILAGLRSWYGGYQFSEECDANQVFNPVSTMESLRKQEFGSYCTSTDSMHFFVRKFYEKIHRWDYFTWFHSMDKDPYRIYRLNVSPSNLVIPWDLWMFSHGYFTISNYKYEYDGLPEKTVTLKFPNKLTEMATEYNLAMYLPEENKFIHQDYANELVEFSNAMSIQDTENAMRILSIFLFRSYISPQNRNMNPGEMARRLGFFLLTASINYQEGVKCNTDTNSMANEEINVDILQTTDLKMNYIIKIQTTNNVNETAFTALEQLREYFRKHPRSFTQGKENQTNFCFLGLSFVYLEGSAKLNSWIALPFVSGVPQYSNVVAQPQNLKQRLLIKFQ